MVPYILIYIMILTAGKLCLPFPRRGPFLKPHNLLNVKEVSSSWSMHCSDHLIKCLSFFWGMVEIKWCCWLLGIRCLLLDRFGAIWFVIIQGLIVKSFDVSLFSNVDHWWIRPHWKARGKAMVIGEPLGCTVVDEIRGDLQKGYYAFDQNSERGKGKSKYWVDNVLRIWKFLRKILKLWTALYFMTALTKGICDSSRNEPYMNSTLVSECMFRFIFCQRVNV